MSWKENFSQSVLDIGLDLFKKGYVSKPYKNSAGYSASVTGAKTYRTLAYISDGSVYSFSCTCKAADVMCCAHEAALMFALEKAGLYKDADTSPAGDSAMQQAGSRSGELFPETGEYSFFDMRSISSKLRYTPSVLAAAKELEKSGHVISLASYPGYGNHDTEWVANVDFGEFTRCRVRLSFTRDTLRSAVCYDYTCKKYLADLTDRYSKGESCRHVLAALLVTDRYLKTEEKIDLTDTAAKNVIAAMKSRSRIRMAGRPAALPGVKLVPRLKLTEYGTVTLSFKTGRGKLYVVKNLSDFAYKVENRKTLRLGTTEVLDFSRDGFDEESRPYYQFLREQYLIGRDIEKEFRERFGTSYSSPGSMRQEIELSGKILDRFFEAAAGKEIELTDKTGTADSKTLLLCENEVPVTLTVIPEKRKGQLDGVTVKGDIPVSLCGAEYVYFLKDGRLSRQQGIDSGELRALFSEDAFDQVLFRVGRGSLADFYRYVLPELKNNFHVVEKEPEALEEFIPPNAEITYYLDSEDGFATCAVKAAYGDQVFECADLGAENPNGGSGQSKIDSLRDTEREKEAFLAAKEYFPDLMPSGNVLCIDKKNEKLFDFFTEGVERLAGFGEVQCTSRFDALRVKKKINLKVGVSASDGINMMGLDIRSDISPEELLEVLKSYRQKKRFHRLKTGEYVSLDEAVAELETLFTGLHLSPKEFVKGKMHIPAYRAIYLDRMLEESGHMDADRNSVFKNLVRDFKTISDSDFEVAGSFAQIMRGYQKFGYKWLRTLDRYGFGGILADEMGLGKTLQAIAVISEKKKEQTEKGEKMLPSLVVCPASLVYNWMSEFSRFAPELSCAAVSGTPAARTNLIENCASYDVLITSYDYLKRDIDVYNGKKFAFEIVDEAQYIKTPATSAAKAVKVIESNTRFALTGTPVENSLSELWSIFDYLMPGYLYPYETFRKELETPIAKEKDEYASGRLKKMTAPFILRRLKKDVLKDLPDKIEEVRYTAFGEAQQKLYDSHVTKVQVMLGARSEQEVNQSKIEVLAELTKLREVCCDPSLLYENYAGSSAKREACLDLIKSAMEGGHKMLVFSQFKSMLMLLAADLEKEGIPYYTIVGDTPKAERLRQAEAFNGDDVPVFLISLKAGGTGLNLTGADVVIHYDPWWNVAAQNQATDRAHRIGQEKAVTVMKLIAKGTIEEKILKMQESKADLAEAVLSGENGSLTRLSKEELLELIGE